MRRTFKRGLVISMVYVFILCVYVNNKEVFADNDVESNIVTGWQYIDEKWYYMLDNGDIATGWKQINGYWYYLENNGSMTIGWKQIGGKWYLLNKSGTMAIGWVKIENDWYYFTENGVMVTGWSKIGSQWYYFYSGGKMAFDTEIDGWKIYGDGTSFPKNIKLDVPTINQHKVGLTYGCEAMATLMVLEYKTNTNFDAYKFGMNIPMDKTPVKTTNGYNGVYQWGDPEIGFVGDITGKKMGSTIYPKPLVNHLKGMGYNAVDLSGKSFESLLDEVRRGNPIVAWVSLNMDTPNNWNTWKTPQGKSVRVTFSAHSVTITGIDDKYVYYNDSWTGAKNKRISKEQFEKVYNWRGKKALVIR